MVLNGTKSFQYKCKIEVPIFFPKIKIKDHLLLEQINAMTVYGMNIFQTLCFMYLCKNGNTPSIFKHIYMLKPINKYTTRSKNILLKPLCKKNFAKSKLSYRGPHLLNKFIARNNDLLEAVTIRI